MAERYFKALVKLPDGVDVSKAFRHLRQYLRLAGLSIPSYRWKRTEDGATYIVVSANTDLIYRVALWKLTERGGVVLSTTAKESVEMMKAIVPYVSPGKLPTNNSRGS